MSMKLRSGDFLKDLDIELLLRSGQTDLVNEVSTDAIVASLCELFDTEIVLTEIERKSKINSEGRLYLIKFQFQIK